MPRVDSADAPPFRDPKPTVERIATLAQRVVDGDILLPKFQREFVWKRRQVRDLLDSIARNYPIGSVLLWQSRQELANDRTIAGLDIAPRRPDYPVNYLLDGQQRLSTICGALFWEPDGDPESMWNLAYDLARERFLHLDTLNDPPSTQVPLRLLSSPSDYFMRTSGLSDPELIQRAKRLFDRFQDYMVAVVTLGDMALEEVGPVFERVNSTGTRLTIVELMRAATWNPDFDLGDSIGQILAALDEKGYGQIDRKVVLRAIAAAAGFGFSTENIEQLRVLDKSALQAAVDATEASARLAADFLVTQIKTPTAAALPYLNQFAVLVEIFRQVPKPTADQYAAIRRWFWRTVFGGYFRGWNNAQMVADRQAIEDFADGDTAEIDVPVALPGPDIWRRTQFRGDNALSKMLVLLLAYQNPRDLRTGQHIDVGQALAWDNTKQFHHFFPKNFLKSQGISFERANVLANIVILTSISNNYISDQRPSAYLQDLIDAYGWNEILSRLNSCMAEIDAVSVGLLLQASLKRLAERHGRGVARHWSSASSAS